MISYIKGILVSMTPGGAVVENNGIGYDIMMPAGQEFPGGIGQEVRIYTHMHVREDDISLFGFRTKEELEAFELLIGVSGIGPKVGLSVLSTLSVYELKIAVMSDDSKTISKTPGLGPKGAKKLILELRDKLDFEEFEQVDFAGDLPEEDSVAVTAQGLVSLGYSRSEAMMAIKKVENAAEYSPEQLLKKALTKLI